MARRGVTLHAGGAAAGSHPTSAPTPTPTPSPNPIQARFTVERVPLAELDPVFNLSDVDVWRLRLRVDGAKHERKGGV